MSTANKHASAPPGAPTTQQDPVFVASFSRLTWRVTLDGAEFGNYRSKQNAIKGVNEARRTDPRLRSAKLVMGLVER